MCGPAYRDESHKSRWLSNMLRHEEWVQHCCERLMTDALHYPTFTASLHSALTQQSLTRDSKNAFDNKNTSEMALPTWYGQRYATPVRRYRFPNSSRENRPRTKRTPQQIQKLKANTRCLKCGEFGHWRAECPNRHMTMTNAIKARISNSDNNPTALHNTLVALAIDEDNHYNYAHDIAANERDNTAHHAHVLDQELDPFDTLLKLLDLDEPPSQPGISDANLTTSCMNTATTYPEDSPPDPLAKGAP